jgi:hypothetical protein
MHTDTSTVENSAQVFVLLADDYPWNVPLISLFFNIMSTFLCNLGQHDRYKNKPVCIVSPKIANGFDKKIENVKKPLHSMIVTAWHAHIHFYS